MGILLCNSTIYNEWSLVAVGAVILSKFQLTEMSIINSIIIIFKCLLNCDSTYYLLFQVLISPVLAGLAVGIGVPILLFYVYGVVPVSLCRSGGCGVTTSGTGVRFEFDDENDILGVMTTKPNGKASTHI